jgi:hypothetical protein
VNAFDTGIMHFLNQFAQHSWVWDSLVAVFRQNHLLKGGVLSAVLAGRTAIRSVADWSFSRPSVFYPAFFLVTFQIADLFDSSRSLAVAAARLVRHALQ